MRPIESDDELRRLHELGRGCIYNDFSGMGARGAKDNVLHSASCSWVVGSNTNVSKVFFPSESEAVNWLVTNRGREGANWKRCDTCRGTTNFSPLVFPVFTEGDVEALLKPWLEAKGYDVTKRHRVSNGIIDMFAVGPDGTWAIEAKGEDKGGYTSAEMNFQMGIGQIVSRMQASNLNYALAIPSSPQFHKVLQEFRGTFGFDRLRLALIVVTQTGDVTWLQAQDVKGYLETMPDAFIHQTLAQD